MSKVFRIYKGGTNTYEGWNDSSAYPYNSSNRDTVEDPEGASAKHEITSIPSPFARIDLIKTAFKEVCKVDKSTKKCDLEGNTIYHKMVSDSLDVGEIFFNIDKFNGKIEIITWNPTNSISDLREDGNTSHFYLADALEKYIKSDDTAYNFGLMKNIYLLNYIKGPDELNIIGATSPSTLFFSSANNLDFITDIYFNQDCPFDNDYKPLYKRDFEYIKSWFTLRKAISNFSTLFPEIEEYLNLTFQMLDNPEQKRELTSLNNSSTELFGTINALSDSQNNIVEVLGYNLLKKSHKPASTISEFTILPTIHNCILPLVLPIEAGNKYSELNYTTGKWGETNCAPYSDQQIVIEKRSLPFDGDINPYITIGDLLEDTLVRVPHTLNASDFYAGNIEINVSKLSYLIPLKINFFKYFTIDDLLNGLPNGDKFIEMSSLAGGSVKVILRIPIRGNDRVSYIEYSRIYYNSKSVVASRNEGGIVDFDFDGHIMPLIEFKDPQKDALYSISCISTYSRKYNFAFLYGTKKIENVIDCCRNDDGAYKYKSINYTLQNSNFNIIRVSDRDNNVGLLIPKFKKQRNINTFDFAVDLGTSNTHIEYRSQNDLQPKPFAFNSNDTLAAHFFKPSYIKGTQDDLIDEIPLIEKDFIPLSIGEKDFQFPARTTLSCSKSIDWTNKQYPYGLFNIPLTYDKRKDLIYNNIKYNIKWGTGDEQYTIDAYVNCLMLMMRNKVLLNDGDLSKTKITWFFPISMAPKRIQKLKETWDTYFNKYFNENGITYSMTESVAPIVYYFSKYTTATNLINIDIGGGTTDIAFAKNKEIMFATSFKYATNVLFENTYSSLDTNNGIIDWHKDNLFNLLQEKGVNELVTMFKSNNNLLPSNMASFLFSLKENSLIKEAGINDKAIDFNSILREDENFKIVIILYYVSIIYHIAHIVKTEELDEPRHIAFSGNGSKIINILTQDVSLLSQFTKSIFEEVLGRKYKGELDIIGLEKNSNPKQSTCKGGILKQQSASNVQTIILSGDCDAIIDKNTTYQDIDNNYKQRVIKSVESFFNFVFVSLNNSFDFDDCFGVTKESIDIAKDICKKDLMTYLDKGIEQRLDESNRKDLIEETTFFYPIKGVINAISEAIYNNLQNS